LWDKLIFVIHNDRHASLLRHNLNGAYLLTVRHGIDYPGVQEFEDLFLDSFPHLVVQPTLRLPRRCAGWVYRDAMGAKGRTNSLEILE
jgi:hypothetical protein